METEEKETAKRLRKSLVKEKETKPNTRKAKKAKSRLGVKQQDKEKLPSLKRIPSKRVAAVRKKRTTLYPVRDKSKPSVVPEGNRMTENIGRLIIARYPLFCGRNRLS